MNYHEFTIKKKNGKLRKIVNPSPELKKKQRRHTKKLNKLLESEAKRLDVWNWIHGFVPNRNCITGASRHIGDYHCVLMMDLSNFFDTVTPNHVSQYDECMYDWLWHRDGYAAQGFPSSPTTCNLAILSALSTIKLELDETLGTDNYIVTIYADDLIISLKQDKWRAVRTIITSVLKDYDFSINPKKTRVRFHKYGAVKILGVNVTPNGIQPTRKTNRKVRGVRHLALSDTSKGQPYSGLLQWQKCKLPKNVMFTI